MAHVPRGLSPRGSIDSMCTASASPFSAPATAIGPFCGLTNGIVRVALGRSDSVWITPPNASRVSTVTRSPGWISRTGVEYGPMVKWNAPWRSPVGPGVVPTTPAAPPRRAMIESSGHPTRPSVDDGVRSGLQARDRPALDDQFDVERHQRRGRPGDGVRVHVGD